MKQKKVHPIIYFSLLFVVLVAIQSYFLYNTVLLKTNEIKGKAQDVLQKTFNVDPFLEDRRLEESLYLWQDFSTKEAAQEEFKAKMKILNDSLAKKLHQYISEQYQKTGLQLAFKKELLGVYDKSNNEKIVIKPIVIYTTNPKPIANHLLSESKWESTSLSSTTETERDTLNTKKLDGKINIARTHEKSVSTLKEYSYIIQQAMYYDVLNMNQILFKELWGLFLVSIILMILVLWLYFQSYKKYKEQLVQVQLLHDTVDNISHEFKTPLATLKIASKQMRFIKTNDTLDLIDRQIGRLEHLLKPLDDDEVVKPVTLLQLTELFNDYKVLYPAINWNTTIQLQEEVICNALELETILNNLIENSIKYGGTNVKVLVKQNEKSLLIKVDDNGIGIAKTEQHKIFDKYYRIATQNVHNVKGLGIGLFLIQKIVLKYNGTITVKSTLGAGCTIKIEL